MKFLTTTEEKYWPRNDPNPSKGYLILMLPPGNTLMVPDSGEGHL
jgi:hypothetical protein